MSETTTISCPKCHADVTIDVHSIIDGTAEPELVAQLLNRSLFEFQCDSCETLCYTPYNLVYVDHNRQFVIGFAKDKESVAEVQTLIQSVVKDGEQVRIVATRNQLIEKIQLFEAEYDDRVIELIKVLYSQKFAKDYPKHPLADILFSTDLDGKHTLQYFIVDNGAITEFIAAPIQHDLYQKIKEDFHFDTRKEKTPMINLAWAMNFMKSHVKST